MKHIRVTISHDESCKSPREWDSPIKLALYMRNYKLPNEIDFGFDGNSSDEDLELLQSKHKYACKVHSYNHSEIAFKTTPFRRPWDSGIAGFAVSDEDFIESEEQFLELVTSDLNEYNDWLNGNCYGYEIEVNGEDVGSCWGFIGDWDKSGILEEIKSTLEYELLSTRPDIVTELMNDISTTMEIDHAYERWIEEEMDNQKVKLFAMWSTDATGVYQETGSFADVMSCATLEEGRDWEVLEFDSVELADAFKFGVSKGIGWDDPMVEDMDN